MTSHDLELIVFFITETFLRSIEFYNYCDYDFIVKAMKMVGLILNSHQKL